ncbi:MAG: polysaccharide export protein [Acidobacteria bacterium]|nr:polysaccharide export protein [Acidobacteriota bacterium]
MGAVKRARLGIGAALLALGVWPVAALAQTPSYLPPGQPVISGHDGYVVGPNDVLTIAYNGEPSMTGQFTVGGDHTITYPLIGRVEAAGKTLVEIQEEVRTKLTTQGFYLNPQIVVSVEDYRPQNIAIVGEVHSPGNYSLPGAPRLVDALVMAGSTLPTAGSEAVIVPAGSQGVVIHSSAAIARGELEPQEASAVTRIGLEGGVPTENIQLHDGDTVFILRAESIYLAGEVARPGAYTMRPDTKTIRQGILLGGGATRRGVDEVQIIRVIDGERKKMKVSIDDDVLPGDTIIVSRRFLF